MRRLLPLLLAALLTITACSLAPAQSQPQPESSPGESPSSAPESAPVSGSASTSEQQEPNFTSLTALYGDNNMVEDNRFAQPLHNVHLLDAWVEDYRQGKPGKVAVLMEKHRNAYLYLFESDGSPTYNITVYYKTSGDGSPEPFPPQFYQSSLVIERACDYVFGADLPAEAERHAFIVRKMLPPTAEEMSWTPETDPPLQGISPEEALAIAEEQSERLDRYLWVKSNMYGGGMYLLENVLAKAADAALDKVYHKVAGAVRLGDKECYVIYGHYDPGQLAKGEHSGRVSAVSSDGSQYFICSMVDGSWIFVSDLSQQVIVPR